MDFNTVSLKRWLLWLGGCRGSERSIKVLFSFIVVEEKIQAKAQLMIDPPNQVNRVSMAYSSFIPDFFDEWKRELKRKVEATSWNPTTPSKEGRLGEFWLMKEATFIHCPPSGAPALPRKVVFASKRKQNTFLLKPYRITYGFACHRRRVGVVW